jgi:hypothetical protein
MSAEIRRARYWPALWMMGIVGNRQHEQNIINVIRKLFVGLFSSYFPAFLA